MILIVEKINLHPNKIISNCFFFYHQRISVPMNISFITTVNHNVGDDFVREGLKFLLKNHFKGKNINFTSIHKHSPLTSTYGFERFKYLRLSKRVDKLIPKGFLKDRVLEADLLIQSGAPVYWCHDIGGSHCYENEWFIPLIKKRFLKNDRSKLLNIAAGTCQKYHSDGSEFCNKCNNYIKDFYNLSTVTTLRDTLAKTVLSHDNIDAPVIPCSSIFACDEYGLKNEGSEYVIMNYMKGGAHYVFGQKIDFEKWENEFKKFYFEIKAKEHVILSCHNKKEVDEALALDPKAEIFYKKDDFLAYMKFYSKAKFGIVNRVHAGFLMASFGKPSIVIGNDSRARMLEEIGLKSYFVNDIDYALLMEQYEYLKSGADNYSERFKIIKEKAYNDYMNALSALND